MSRIFITGSSDGLGLLAAKELAALGHEVVLHARNNERAKSTLENVPGALDVLIADLSDIKETVSLASKANRFGTFDAVIHNAALYHETRIDTDGLPVLFKVNSLAPYILTCLVSKPKRLIYMSSDMHFQGDASLENLPAANAAKENQISYSDTKLHVLLLSKAVARRWKGVHTNALHPGWVPTKMGGPGAPDNLGQGFETQVWLAVSNDPDALVTGKYFYHKQQHNYLPVATEIKTQDKFLAHCEKLTIRFD